MTFHNQSHNCCLSPPCKANWFISASLEHLADRAPASLSAAGKVCPTTHDREAQQQTWSVPCYHCKTTRPPSLTSVWLFSGPTTKENRTWMRTWYRACCSLWQARAQLSFCHMHLYRSRCMFVSVQQKIDTGWPQYFRKIKSRWMAFPALLGCS